MPDDPSAIAATLWTAAQRDEQAVRRIPSDELAEQVRAEVRRLAAADGVSVRTARLDDTVAVVRSDAAIWTDPTAVMRAKLAPEEATDPR